MSGLRIYTRRLSEGMCQVTYQVTRTSGVYHGLLCVKPEITLREVVAAIRAQVDKNKDY